MAAPDAMYDGDTTAAPDPFAHHVPTGMDAETLGSDGRVRVNQQQGKPTDYGGWWKIIWQTRLTENNEIDREKVIKTTLRELIIYLMFLVTLCIISFGMVSSSMFYFTNIIQGVFLVATTPPFANMLSFVDFWNYLIGNGTMDNNANGLLQNLYPDAWYNGMEFSLDDSHRVVLENKLLGVPRMRQVKITNNSCTVPTQFQQEIQSCYDSYSVSEEDTAPFGPFAALGTAGCLQPDNSSAPPVCTAWQYTDASAMGAITFTGTVTFTVSSILPAHPG